MSISCTREGLIGSQSDTRREVEEVGAEKLLDLRGRCFNLHILSSSFSSPPSFSWWPPLQRPTLHRVKRRHLAPASNEEASLVLTLSPSWLLLWKKKKRPVSMGHSSSLGSAVLWVPPPAPLNPLTHRPPSPPHHSVSNFQWGPPKPFTVWIIKSFTASTTTTITHSFIKRFAKLVAGGWGSLKKKGSAADEEELREWD